MSSGVRLVCYPRSQSAFDVKAALHLKIEIPGGFAPEEIVREIQARLRDSYPLAVIRMQEPTRENGQVTWYVYRDGLLTTA